jgi:hypothetical protein
LRVAKHGNYVFVRSAFSSRYDLVVRVGKGSNRQINFSNTRLVPVSAGMDEGELNGGTLIHGNGDDATPWNINGTYIGGNHGCSDTRELTCPNHGMTVADLGSEWGDEAGTKFYLLKIADENHLWFLSQDFGKGDIWRFSTKYVGSNLRRTTGRGSLNFGKVRMVQLRPACRIHRQDYLADGKTPLVNGMPVSCTFLDIVEEYDIRKMGPIIPAGTPFYCIAYRQYFCPAAQQHATCFYLHKESGDTVVYADYHKSVERDVLRLPGELTGRSITVIEKTPSVTLHSTGTVPSGGAAVSVADDYGYIVFKVR